MSDFVLGVDLGTGSMKFIVMDKLGEVVEEVSSSYDLISPKPGYSEQNPIDWISAFKNNVKKLKEKNLGLMKSITGLSISGQMHSLVILDSNMEVIRNAILWNDVRTTQQCEKIEELLPELHQITRNKALEGFTLPKLLWLEEHENSNYKKINKFLLPKDYITYWLTGEMCMDLSDAAGTLLLDVDKRKWSKEIQKTFSINEDIYPQLVQSGELIGTIKQEVKDILGLNNDIKVFAGGADNACAAIGSGISEHHRALSSLGTSGVFLAYEEDSKNDYEGKLHFFNHSVKDGFYSMGVTLAAGNSLNWYKNNFAPKITFDELLDTIESVRPGSDGLLFTPYLSGERSPHVDSKVRGSFIGIDINHTMAHFTRAVIEGITFSLRDTQEIMKKLKSKEITEIISIGGGAKNTTWLQIQADIFNTTIRTLKNEQGPAMGACYIAAVALGWYSSIQECTQALVKYDKTYEPILENVKEYNRSYSVYKQIYNQTKGLIQVSDDGK